MEDNFGPPHPENRFEKTLIFATVVTAMLGGLWKLTERKEEKARNNGWSR